MIGPVDLTKCMSHPRRQNIVTQSNKPKHLAEHNSILHGGEHMSLGPAHYTLGTHYVNYTNYTILCESSQAIIF